MCGTRLLDLVRGQANLENDAAGARSSSTESADSSPENGDLPGSDICKIRKANLAYSAQLRPSEPDRERRGTEAWQLNDGVWQS
jgi:hypothetical protein